MVLRRRVRGITDGKGDAVAVGLKRLEQRLALKNDVGAFAAGSVAGATAAKSEFENAGEVSGGHRPVFAAALIGANP